MYFLIYLFIITLYYFYFTFIRYYSNRLSNYDRKNNVEQIVIPSPSNGIWTVSIMNSI